MRHSIKDEHGVLFVTDEDLEAAKAFLAHEGTPRHSGRYPWGSGENPHQRNKTFLDHVDSLKKKGMTEPDIAKAMSMTTTQLRAVKAIAKNEMKKAQYSEAYKLQQKGMSNGAIAERLGMKNESSVRALLQPATQEKADVLQNTSEFLKREVAEKGFLDIGAGTEHYVVGGISATKLNTAVAMLREEGYEYHKVKVPQLGTGKFTEVKVLAPPGTTYKDIVTQPGKIKSVAGYTEDGGKSWNKIEPPTQVDSKRIYVRYGEHGGADKDGVIEIRRNVDDVGLGNARYAQVRVAVDGTHYLKGMAMYSDNIPAGHDIVFNTNKSNTGNKLDAMKKMNKTPEGDVDQENPFGATIRQRKYTGKDGKLHLSPMNIVNEEGSWDEWGKSLSSQMLSKQSPQLAKRQLDLTFKSKKQEYEEIMALTNPTIKKKLLESFADDADASAVHLKAAAMPRQRTQVILPLNSLKPDEVYAPNFRDGEKVMLVRYPHGGKFEIPELTVNNRHPEGNRLLKQAKDAIGIHTKVAERLSGADFDGDTVIVIPNNARHVRNEKPLKELEGFNPRTAYPEYPGMPKMKPATKQQKMGDVSNLITDMTIRGASNPEIARAVKHSMVVIDAEKHNLNWRQSAKDMGIAELKAKYQKGPKSGASTLISQASSNVKVNERKDRSAAEGGRYNARTGEKMFTETGRNYTIPAHDRVSPKTGKVTHVPEETVFRKTDVTRMDLARDAHELNSGTVMETIYADHANRLKALGNTARKSYLETPNLKYDPQAKSVYAPQVASLKAKLNVAQKNAPLERQAQIVANVTVKAKQQAKPEMDKDELKKIKGRALVDARIATGANKVRIGSDTNPITPLEWQAIQSGAISDNFLRNILANSDLDKVKALATPRAALEMTPTKQSRAEAMLAAGHTQADVADALGVSVSTLNASLKEGG